MAPNPSKIKLWAAKQAARNRINTRKKYFAQRLNFYQAYKEHNGTIGTNDFGGKSTKEDGATLDRVDGESPQP